MARDDNEIKGEIIGEIEEIEDPATGKSLLDALMVERVEVDKGHVTIDLVFDDDRPRQERWDIENEVQDAIEDIEGIEDIDIFAHTRSAVEAASDTSSSPTEPEPESAPDAFAADAVEEDGERDGESRVSVYSGGGCSAGTVASPSVTVAAAPATDLAGSVASDAASAPVAEPSMAVVERPAPVEGNGQQVVLSLETYTRLVKAERDAQLRPTAESYNALVAEHRILKARVESLQDAVRALLRGVEAEA